MLTPEQLAHCADDILRLYAQLEDEIIRDVARRIVKAGKITDTGEWQINALQEVGTLHSDIISSIAKYSGLSDEQIKKLFEDTSVTATEYDNEIYRANGLKPVSIKVSASALQILEAGYKKTIGNINNLTRTTAITSQTSFINACTLAEMKVTSGAFTYQQAITDAIKQVAKDGAYVFYESGHRDRLDVAVRRNVMTGIGQTTGEICLANARELGCDLMEITAHAGARPSHASWQGQIVSLSGRNGYLSLSDIGYGTGDGFKGWNCRHDWYPYFEGSTRMYSAKELEELDEENIEFPDGSMHTLYEAEQQQRAYERKIRETKRILVAQDEVINNTDNDILKNSAKTQFDKYTLKLKEQEQNMKAFCNYTGLRTDSARTQTLSFNKSISQKAVQRNKHINEVADMYKVDFGKMNKLDIFNLDKRALQAKYDYFTSDYKRSGNFAIMHYNGEYYYAHSQANIIDGVENTAFSKYKGDKSHLARTNVDESKRNFNTFDVEQSTGKKFTPVSNDINRFNTFEDTEAKLFESLENMWYNGRNKTINILSERGMCDSCKYVAEQFMKKHPEAKVNVVSGVQVTGSPWKGRKPYD